MRRQVTGAYKIEKLNAALEEKRTLEANRAYIILRAHAEACQ